MKTDDTVNLHAQVSGEAVLLGKDRLNSRSMPPVVATPSLGSRRGSKAGLPVESLLTLNSNYSFRWGANREEDHWLLGHPGFKGVMTFAIFVNVVQMGVEAQEPSTSGSAATVVIGNVVTVVFVMEMLAKACIMRAYYFRHIHQGPWNAIDFLVTMTAILDMWVVPSIDAGSTNFGIVRVFRLLRLLRVLRLIHNVPELFCVIEGMVASFKSMLWIILLLATFIYMASILCVEVVGNSDAYPSRNYDKDVMLETERGNFNNALYFGTLSRATMSLCSIVLLAEWGAVVRPVSAAQPAMVLVFGILILLTTFGFFNIIIGVIVERTTDAMARVRAEKERICLNTRMKIAEDIADVIYELDANGDGVLSYEEFAQGDTCEKFRVHMAGLDLPPGFTLQDLFTMLDHDASQELTRDELVIGLLRLIKGTPFQHQCMQHLLLAQIRAQIINSSEETRCQVRAEVASLRAQLQHAKQSKDQMEHSVKAEFDSLRAELQSVPGVSAKSAPFGSHTWGETSPLLSPLLDEAMSMVSEGREFLAVVPAESTTEAAGEARAVYHDVRSNGEVFIPYAGLRPTARHVRQWLPDFEKQALSQ